MSEFVPLIEARRRKHRVRRIVLRIVAIVAVVAVIIALCYFVTTFLFRSIDTAEEPQREMALSEQTVQTQLNNSEIPIPDLSSYAYVDASNLVARIEDITVGESQTDPIMDQTYRDVTIDATYRNSSITVNSVLTQRYTYDASTTSWSAGSIQILSSSVVPTRALSTTTIQNAIPSLLEVYDPSLAEQFEGCSILLSSSLNETGGTATAELTQSTYNSRLNCTVYLDVTWNESSGWEIAITSASPVTRA